MSILVFSIGRRNMWYGFNVHFPWRNRAGRVRAAKCSFRWKWERRWWNKYCTVTDFCVHSVFIIPKRNISGPGSNHKRDIRASCLTYEQYHDAQDIFDTRFVKRWGLLPWQWCRSSRGWLWRPLSRARVGQSIINWKIGWVSRPTWSHCNGEHFQNKKLRLKDLYSSMTSMRVDLLEKKMSHDDLFGFIQGKRLTFARRSNNSLRVQVIISNESMESSTNVSIVRRVGISDSTRSNGTPELQGNWKRKKNQFGCTTSAAQVVKWLSKHLVFEPVHEDLYNLLLRCSRSP